MEIKGIDELILKLSLFGGDTEAAVTRGMKKATALVQGDAKRLCPVDTGRLRESITTKVETDGTDVVGTVGTATSYAPFVEFGTGQRGDSSVAHRTDWKGQAPQPFLYPALKQNERNVNDIIKLEVLKEISRKGG